MDDHLPSLPPAAAEGFGPALRHGPGSAGVRQVASQAHAGRVASLLFDDLQLRAGPAEAPWRSHAESLNLPLQQASRRRIRWMLRGSLVVTGSAVASICLQAEGRCKRFSLRGPAQASSAAGPAMRSHALALSLTLPRHLVPRRRTTAVVWLEVTADQAGDHALATVDSLDIALV